MGEHNRREFLGLTIPATIALGAGLESLKPSRASAAETQPPTSNAAVSRNYGSASFALELDQQHAGWLDSVEGGDATSDVVTDNAQRKHLAGVKYEDIVLTCGAEMSKNFYDWIKASLDRHPLAKSGAIITFDATRRIISRLEFTNGFLTEIAFPALDASSKDAAKMTLKITPAFTQMAPPRSALASPAASRGVQKKWLASNFRLQIAGCATACSHVSTVDAIVLKSGQATAPVGVTRAIQFAPRTLEIPNISLATAEADAGEFFNWYQDFLIKGQNTADKEKAGTLDYLAADLKPLFSLSLAGLGIFKFAPENVEAGVQSIRRVKASMYCDSIGFTSSA